MRGCSSALALAAAFGGEGWTSALGDLPSIVAMLVAGLAVAAVSPELDLSRRARDARLQARESVCAHRRIPPEHTIARLRASELWSQSRSYLSEESPLEQWREGCWRYLVYPARYDGASATAVFALYLGRDRSADGVAFVDEADQRVLAQIRASK